MLHRDLTPQRWHALDLNHQMANIGSEISRSIKWRDKKNHEYATLANHRALELFDLTISDPKHQSGLVEITRARELWLDFFIGENQYRQTAEQWQKYFRAFNYAANNPNYKSDLTSTPFQNAT